MQWQNRNNWDGTTFVENDHYRFRGHEVRIERRWTVSDDGSEIQISERIQGPQGPFERVCSIPVA